MVLSVVAGEERGGPLDQERQALLELAAWSAGVEAEVFGPEHEVDISATLGVLAELTERETRTAPRLVLFERLVRAASRRGDEFLAPDNEGLRLLLEAVIEKTRLPIADRPGALEVVEGALRRVNGLNAVDAYSTFANIETKKALSLEPHEVHAPVCNDDVDRERRSTSGAPGVDATFFSKVPFDGFTHWMDPVSWVQMCPWFFTGMKLVGVRNPTTSGGWNAIYDETVKLMPNESWTTRLRFDHKRRQDEHRTDYRLPLPGEVPAGAAPAPVQHLVVDHGYLSAERCDWKYEGFITKVTLVKRAAFADSTLGRWTTIMCDTFWLDLAIAMAHTAATTKAPPDDGDGGVDDHIDPDE